MPYTCIYVDSYAHDTDFASYVGDEVQIDLCGWSLPNSVVGK